MSCMCIISTKKFQFLAKSTSHQGNFVKTLYTMFEITFSGSWPSRIRPVTAKVSGWYAVPFLLYIALVVFAVIKIVTALFLKETLHSAANDADMMLEDSERVSKSYQNKIEGLFRLADNDGDGLLTLEEFMETMNLQSVQHYLKILDVTTTDSRSQVESLGCAPTESHEFDPYIVGTL